MTGSMREPLLDELRRSGAEPVLRIETGTGTLRLDLVRICCPHHHSESP